jgi:hypothetical protein
MRIFYMTKFFVCNVANLVVLSRYQCVLNIADTFYFIFNIVWL